jgi:FixJ family two-component response regulator
VSGAAAVWLVDDNESFRRSTAWLLEVEGFEVRDFGSAEAALAALLVESGPAAVLSDVRMPGITGVDLVRRLHAERPHLPVVLITGHGDVALAVAAMREGAVDFIEKPFEVGRVVHALREAIDQGRVKAAPRAKLDALTRRERQVLDLVVAGRLNKQIADELNVSIKTVELHRSNMMNKLGVRHLADLLKLVLAA